MSTPPRIGGSSGGGGGFTPPVKLPSPRYKRTQLHPIWPVMYFQPFSVTTTPEVEFNDVSYYENVQAYESSAATESIILRDEVAQSHDYTDTDQQPFRLMTLSVGDTRPAHLPLLKDLDGYLHKGVSCFVKWYFENASESDVGDTIIPPLLTPMFDMKPIVEPEHLPVYALPLRKRYIFFGASTLAFHVMKVTNFMTMIKLKVFSDVTNDTKTRYHYVTVKSSQEVDVHVDRPHFETGSTFILMNGRGIHRPSFIETFNKLYFELKPVVVVVTEARPSKEALDFLRTQLQGVFEVEAFGGDYAYGGAVLIWDKVGIHPWINHRGKRDMGHIMGVSIQPGWKTEEGEDTPPARSPTPPSNWYEDAGLDLDGSVHDYSRSPPSRTPSPKRLAFGDDSY